MEAGATSRFSRVLLTGPPGIGKTTICKKVAAMLEKQNHKFDGFYTEEVRGQNNSRIGFDVVLVKNPEKRSTLATAESVLNQSQYSKHKVGNYHVFLHEFEAAALPVFNSDADILFIDEIGKMELFSQKFCGQVQKLFFGTPKEIRVIATIPQMHKVPQRHLPLFQKLHEDKKSLIIKVNQQNRDNLPEEICRIILKVS